MGRWEKGGRTIQYLLARGRLESFAEESPGSQASALIDRASLRVGTTAAAALEGGDVDGAYVAAYDAYRMTAESLLARQGLRATYYSCDFTMSARMPPVRSHRGIGLRYGT